MAALGAAPLSSRLGSKLKIEMRSRQFNRIVNRHRERERRELEPGVDLDQAIVERRAPNRVP
jgi:hypothetical protein